MRNNRNTVGDQFKPTQPRNLANSVDRKTMTNPQNHQTQSRQYTQQQLNQKMALTINSTLLRLPNQGNRSSISNSLQPKASTLISTISSFMNSIDRNFQKNNLQIQNIPQLLNFWGYPHTYNKSVFQPIGAPHTWYICLQMMQFLADITNYFFEYRLQFDEYKLDIEEIDLILQAFAKDDNTQFQSYLKKIKSNLVRQQQQLLFKIQSSQLTLRNIKNSQRSIVQMQTQQSILLQKLQRESQNVIQIDQQNNSIRNQIQKIDDNYQQLSITKQSLLKKIQILQQEISNQQLSLQEATKIEIDIKQYHGRIKDNNNQLQNKKKQYQSQKIKIVDRFYKIVDDINQIKNSCKRYQGQLKKRAIQMHIPQTDHVAFTEAIHTEDMTAFVQAANKMIEGEKIKSMLIAQQSLADVLQHQTKTLNNQLAQTHLNKNQVQHENRQVLTEVQKLQKYRDQLQKQIQSLMNKRNRILQRTDQTKQNTNSIKLHNQQLLRRQIQLTQQTKQRKQNMMEGIKLLKKFENDSENMLRAMEQKQIQTKKKVQQILQRTHGGFQYLSQQLQNLI